MAKYENGDMYHRVEEQIALIVQELKELNHWQDVSPDPKVFENMGAFGSNTMPFTMWLQFVFVPNVKKIITERGTFPQSSQVATYAYRNLDEGRYERLNTLLSEFDAIFN